MLIGTDYNSGGIKGIGPKNALKMIKKYGDNFGALFNEAKWQDFFDFEWQEVFDLFKNIPVNKNYELKWTEINEEKILKLLVDKHDFSEERVKSQIEGLLNSKEKRNQKGLKDFFN
jgi:flap endonuclease-1